MLHIVARAKARAKNTNRGRAFFEFESEKKGTHDRREDHADLGESRCEGERWIVEARSVDKVSTSCSSRYMECIVLKSAALTRVSGHIIAAGHTRNRLQMPAKSLSH